MTMSTDATTATPTSQPISAEKQAALPATAPVRDVAPEPTPGPHHFPAGVLYHRYDVVIVGAGGAGMRAALESGQRAKTAVLTKLYPTRSHTGAAQGGMCAALANVEEDNWEWHTFDTVKGGDYLVDQDAAEIMCKEAIDAVLDLEKMGLPFNRTPEGRIDQRRFGGHTRDHGKAPVRRSCFAADRTGHMILQTLYQQCVKHDVEFFNEFYVLDLLMTGEGDERVASGAVAYELATGTIHVFHAKAVILATGGFGKVFKTTSNAHTLTGDGMGVAYRRGLPLEDMEFYQFHPTGLAGLGILLSEAARGEGGILRNKDGERFMERYAPTIKDLAPRDMVSRAIYNEVKAGRGAGPHGDYVYLDLTHLPREVIDAKLPDITEFARTYLGVEPYTEGVPIYPTAHYAMGGVPTDTDAKVLRNNDDVVPGLGPRRQPPRHQLAARHQRLRAAGGAGRGRVHAVLPRLPRAARGGPGPGAGSARWAAQLDRLRAGRRDPHRAAGHDGRQRVGLPYRGDAQAGRDRHRRAAGALRPDLGDGQGPALQHRAARGGRAGLPAGAGRGARRERPGQDREPWWARP